MVTVAAIMGGLLPIMWTTGTGADVIKRIAAPMIGGMVSSTILTLIVIPILYYIWKRRIMRSDSPTETTFARPTLS
jgi:copper/silver efflux system protein